MPELEVPSRLTKAYLKGLSDEGLIELYNHLFRTDEYLSFGGGIKVNSRLIRTREEAERRGIL